VSGDLVLLSSEHFRRHGSCRHWQPWLFVPLGDGWLTLETANEYKRVARLVTTFQIALPTKHIVIN
jgi:hypothetical protein